jgi:hypothetical protein
MAEPFFETNALKVDGAHPFNGKPQHHMPAAAIPLDQIGDEVSATLRDGCLRAPSHAATALIRSG